MSCSDAAELILAEERRAEALRLAYAAHWADLHPAYSSAGRDRRGADLDALGVDAEGPVDGVPLVAEFAAAELGVRLPPAVGNAASS